MSQKLQELILTDSLNDKGRAKAFSDKTSFEVVGGLENEKVEVQIVGGSKKEKIAKVVNVIKSSPKREIPCCSHVPECGGCSIQQMNYNEQLLLKESKIKALFDTFNPTFYPILPSKDIYSYRNKMEFSFSQDREGNQYLGLVLAGSRGLVMNTIDCKLVHPWMMELLQSVREFWKNSSLKAYLRNDTGSLRTLTLREGMHTNEKMVILTVSGNPDFALRRHQLNAFKDAIIRVVGEEVSIFLIIQQIKEGSPTQFFEMHLHGKDHILEKLTIFGKEYLFKISPTSFFQPNSSQAEKLYERALELACHVKKIDHALDLYSGTSTFSIALATVAKKVTAIELNPHAVFDAQENIENNGIENITLLQGDVADKLKELSEPIDLIALDPPRVGCGPKGVKQLISLSPKVILYISCNPKTQAFDIQALVDAGYLLRAVQPVDQFPHTIHCENICIIERKD